MALKLPAMSEKFSRNVSSTITSSDWASNTNEAKAAVSGHGCCDDAFDKSCRWPLSHKLTLEVQLLACQ